MSVDGRQLIEALYRTNRDKMFRCAYRLIGRVDKAEELVQEAFVLALIHESKLMNHPNPMSWLIVTLKYQIMNDRRRKESSSEISLDDFFSLEAEPLKETLDTSLPKELSDSERQLLIWKFAGQIDYEEMSERLGITKNAC